MTRHLPLLAASDSTVFRPKWFTLPIYRQTHENKIAKPYRDTQVIYHFTSVIKSSGSAAIDAFAAGFRAWYIRKFS